MRKLLAIYALLIGSLFAAAKDCNIPVSVKITDNTSKITASSLSTIESALSRALSRNGFVASDENAKFCLTATVDETSNNLIGGIRPSSAISLDINLSIVNTATGENFAGETITLNGASSSEAAAYRKVVSQIKNSDKILDRYIADSSDKIIEYYNKQLDNMLKDVDALLVQRDFTQAMWVLSSIPSCVKNYDKVLKKMSAVFQMYIDLDCRQKIATARALWGASQDRDGAKAALAALAGIDPESACSDDADKLYKEIFARIKELNTEDKDLEKEMIEFHKEMTRSEIENERARIEAMRAIGKAYGENQPEQNIIIH